VLFAVNWLVEGKFYSIFSMLLGAGFALQLSRAQARGAPATQFASFFRRRMLVLAGIGLVHMYRLWAGDILTLYGVMGLLLPALWRLPSRMRAWVTVLLFTVPLMTHAVVLSTDGAADPRKPFAAAGARVREVLAIESRETLDVFAHSSARDYWAWNTAYAVTRPGTYLQSGRPAKVLALFLLGAWLASSVLPRLSDLRGSLWATAFAGGAVGLAASHLYATIKAATGSTFLLSREGVLQTLAYTLGTTPLALAYPALAILIWRTTRGRAWLGWFEPLGRMALSVYLTQTVIQVALFSGVGLGLAGRIPIATLPAVATVILVLQRFACVVWLQHHNQGPLEWMWRRATYGPAAPSR
jgi:uncharacterized protein